MNLKRLQGASSQGRQEQREFQLKVKVLSVILSQVTNIVYQVNYIPFLWKPQSPVLIYLREDVSYNNALNLFNFFSNSYFPKEVGLISLIAEPDNGN